MDGLMARKHPASASGQLRPEANRQFKLLPVPCAKADGWNDRVLRWAGAR